MTQGEIVEAGPTAAIFARPHHPYTQRLLAAEPKGRAPPADPAAPELMAATDVKVWFPIRSGLLRRVKGYVKAVDGVSLAVRRRHHPRRRRRERLGQDDIGSGAVAPDSKPQGSIRFAGHDIAALGQRQMRPLRREMQVVFQDPFSSLSPRLSIAQIVGEGLKVHRLAASEAERRRLIETDTRGGRARPRGGRALPARILRRPAPAHRHRPRAGAEAALYRARRADLGARHVGAGADRRAVARIANPPRPRLPVHQP